MQPSIALQYCNHCIVVLQPSVVVQPGNTIDHTGALQWQMTDSCLCLSVSLSMLQHGQLHGLGS